MTFSFDIVFLIVNLFVLAFSYGRFSARMSYLEKRFDEKMGDAQKRFDEKIDTMQKTLDKISATLEGMNSVYYSAKDGVKLEVSMSALWSKFDTMKEHCVANHGVKD